MTVTIDLPEDALARLRDEATCRGVRIETVIAKLAGQLLMQQAATGRRPLVLVGVGASRAASRRRFRSCWPRASAATDTTARAERADR